MREDAANFFGAIFLISIVTFVALGMIWCTGILLDIKTVRWCLQLNAIVTVTAITGIAVSIVTM